MKATHSGSCQCCGSQQKLPNDRLSKHGYTVEYGWFNGVCRGAGHEPFEVSCKLIETFIKQAEEHKASIEAQIKKWNRTASEDACWIHAYRKTERFGISRYVWEYVPAFERQRVSSDGDYKWNEFYVLPASQKLSRLDAYGSDKNLRQTCTEANRRYVKATLVPALAQVTQYIAWQRERVANWQPHPEKLVAVK